jgi:hypothetical protein
MCGSLLASGGAWSDCQALRAADHEGLLWILRDGHDPLRPAARALQLMVPDTGRCDGRDIAHADGSAERGGVTERGVRLAPVFAPVVVKDKVVGRRGAHDCPKDVEYAKFWTVQSSRYDRWVSGVGR